MTSDGTPRGDRPRIVHLGFEDFRRPGSGGGAIRSHEINRRLAEHYDITMLTTSWPGCEDRVEDGVRYVHIGLPRGYFPSILSYFAHLPFALRRWPADLVVEDFAAPFSSALSPLWTRRPVVAVVQWLNAREKTRQYHLPFHLVEDLGVRLHQRYVVVSEGIADEVRRRSPGAEITVVPNGIDPAAFRTTPTAGDDVVFVGRLEIAQKGLDLLLEAFAQAADRLPGNLLIVGDGPDEARLRRMVDQLDVRDRVRFVGRRDGAAKFDLMAGAGAVAMSSRFETFGIVAVEALASGTPVVAFDIACLREVVPPGLGRLVPAFDVAAFADALVATVADRAGAQSRVDDGRRFAHRFDWPAVAEQQRAVYERALGRTGINASSDPADSAAAELEATRAAENLLV